MAEFVRVVAESDELFDAASSLGLVEEVVEKFDRNGRPRDLQALDLFCGEGNFQHECERSEIPVEGIDILKDEVNHNILTAHGFSFHFEIGATTRFSAFNLFHMCRCEAPLGMILCGPPCSLFVFMSSSVHRRSGFIPYGDQSKRCVRAMNQLLINLVVLLALAHTRKQFILMLG